MAPIEIFLSVMKFAGIIIAGGLSILGTIIETHDEREVPARTRGDKPRTVRRLNRWGKWARSLTIIGVMVAIAAQFCEEAQRRHDAKKTKDEASDELRRATETLSELRTQSLLTHRSLEELKNLSLSFDNVSIGARIVLPGNPRLFARYAERVREAISSAPDRYSVHLNESFIAHFGAGDDESFSAGEESPLFPKAESEPLLSSLVRRLEVAVNIQPIDHVPGPAGSDPLKHGRIHLRTHSDHKTIRANLGLNSYSLSLWDADPSADIPAKLRSLRQFKGATVEMVVLVQVDPNEQEYYFFNDLAPELRVKSLELSFSGRKILLSADMFTKKDRFTYRFQLPNDETQLLALLR